MLLALALLVLGADPDLPPGTTCRVDADCVLSSVERAVESAADCHLGCCGGALMNRAAATRFREGFERFCAAREELRAQCAAAICERRGEPRCIEGRCAEASPDRRDAPPAPCAAPQGLAEALESPDGEMLCMEAFVAAPPEACSPCAKGAACKPCLSTFWLLRDRPDKGAAATAWGDGLTKARVGDRVRLRGSWGGRAAGGGRVFLVRPETRRP